MKAYRIFDPLTQRFVASGSNNHTGRNRRSIWLRRNQVTLTLKFLPKTVRNRVEVKTYTLLGDVV